jgi:NADH dehydrogenase
MHVVIIGGGFAGVYAAKHLLKKKVDVTLISKTNYFLFTPLLHEVAVGSVNRHDVCTPIRDVLGGKGFTFIRSEVEKVDSKKKKVHVAGKIVDYDSLIISIGSEVNYFGIKGAQENSVGLKGIRDAIEIRNRMIAILEESDRKDKSISIAVVGAGPTGVELCGDIIDFIDENIKTRYPRLHGKKNNYYLIQAAEDILPVLSKKSRQFASDTLARHGITVMTDSKVTEVGKDFVKIGDKKLGADLIIWSGGIRPTELNTVPRLQDDKGYFAVDGNLRVDGAEGVYAVGDCSKSGTPWVAQAAIQEAEAVAKMINGMQQAFKFNNKGLIVSLGKQRAVGEIYLGKKTFIVKGKLAWMMKRHIYFTNILGLGNKVRVGLEWMINLMFGRDTSEI